MSDIFSPERKKVDNEEKISIKKADSIANGLEGSLD
jgi:hypothetical protein